MMPTTSLRFRVGRARSVLVFKWYRLVGWMLGIDEFCDTCGVPNAGDGVYAGEGAESCCRVCAGS